MSFGPNYNSSGLCWTIQVSGALSMKFIQHPTLSDSRRREFATLVADRYQIEFGDRLSYEQILEPARPSQIFAEYNSNGEMIAGVKLAPLADSFSARCVGDRKLKDILGDVSPADVVEVSKAVNLGGLIVSSRLIAKSYRWLDEHADNGFVSVGQRKKAELYRWLLAGSWHKPWDVEIHSVPHPEVEVPDDIDLAVLWAKPNFRWEKSRVMSEADGSKNS